MFKLTLPPISDRADFVLSFGLIDEEYQEPILLDGYRIELALFDDRCRTPQLSVSSDDDEVTVDGFTVTWFVSKDNFDAYYTPRSLQIGCTLSLPDDLGEIEQTVQLFIADVPIISGRLLP